MENLLSLCGRRCSVRAFSERRISEADLSYIMECVRLAPSACNRQPWRFLRVSDDERHLICQCYTNPWFAAAPDYVIACCDHDVCWKRSSDGKDHGNIDVAIAVEHFCLAAAERSVATCWVCNFDADKCRRLFALPDHIEPVAFLPLGYPAQGYVPRESPRLAEHRLWLER